MRDSSRVYHLCRDLPQRIMGGSSSPPAFLGDQTESSWVVKTFAGLRKLLR